MKTKLSILGILLLLGACVTMQPKPLMLAKGFGYSASQYYLLTHPDKITEIKIGVEGALSMLDSDTAILYSVHAKIYDYGWNALKDLEGEKGIAARTAFFMFNDMFSWDLPDTPELTSKYKDIIEGFLLGVKQAIKEMEE